jgi:uncharacterized RDD family membrane protein YckC
VTKTRHMENSFDHPNQPQDLLADMTINLQQASRGKRFANYLIDVIVLYLIALVFFALLATTGLTERFLHNNDFGTKLLDRLVTSIVLGVLWGITEALFKGKTLGKVITRTRAVNEDGSPITVKTAFLRGLSRIVPFEAFSALGDPSYPWHDSWTRTYVIDEKLSMVE